MAEPFLELRDIGKVYPGVAALKGVSLSVAPGEVIGLVGENGAGKSTLMKVLGGVVAPTTGTIRIDGADRPAMTCADAIAAGIAFVHQELNLFDNLDAAANVFIGREPVKGPFRLVDRKRMAAEAAPLLRRLGADFGPETPVVRLSLAQQQLLEIAKALSLDSRVVIMDEPTSSLTLSETARLLKVIADLKASGVSVIFISHRLDEVKTCADRVVVLRDGQMVGRLDKGEITPAAMIRLMIGRDLRSIYQPPAGPAGEAVLSVEGLRTSAYPERTVDLTRAPRGDPRAGRADRGRADGAGAGGVRGRPRARGDHPARGAAGGGGIAARCDRGGDLPDPGGPQGLRNPPRPVDRRRTSACRSLPALAEGGLVSREKERALAEGERRGATSGRRGWACGSGRSRAETSRRWCWPSGCRCIRRRSSSTSRRAGSTSAPSGKSTTCCGGWPTKGWES